MNAKYYGLAIVETACVSVLTMIIVRATGEVWLKIIELTLAVVLLAFLLRSNRLAATTFLVAASAVVTNQMLLAYGYLTFLNAGQAFATSSFGAIPAGVMIGVVVASVTAGAFYLRRTWAYVTVIVLLIAVTWPTPLTGLSI